ncbi:major tail tube protein [[Actinobacillus] muris]|uniref:Major tail tube protein n=1 Tax=Muribacter muris TaxID=67855 RepID=A0A0J5S0V0_9PAST|nr:phage major tail tube protein [Muribacter muris]KMK50487.1 major tail tube protein [[Actinobacillus] muris] [Muribacter muris]
MALPRKLKNFNGSVDSVSYHGEITEVTLPKLTQKMEEYRSGGMFAPVKVNLGHELLEAEFKVGGLTTSLLKLYGKGIQDTMFRFNGAYQQDDTDEVSAVDILMKGRIEEIDGGNSKAGDDTEFSYKMALSYYKLSVDGADIIEIDVLNYVFKVDGKDLLSEHRKAMGL